MRPFTERYRTALANEGLRDGLLAFQRSWRATRDARIAELEADREASFDTLRAELAAIKDRVIADLGRYVDEFERNAEAAGATVYRAASAEAANGYIRALLERRGVQLLVKGKSMVSEEIELNEHLAAAGVRVVETDLGEWLIQLAGERPSHLVMPAIHQRREEVAALLGAALDREFDPDDIPAMVHAARGGLREAFLSAGAGLTGANALIADSGTLLLVTNEGNGRMASSLPPLHIVTAGIEKIVPSTADAMKQVRLLARSATGQPISTYTTLMRGPTAGHELHIVLIDNGRLEMAADPQFADALRCIRCGACANVCPPYQVVGGHAFGHIYTGAIGLVNTPFHHGLEAVAGPQSLCISCGACETVCPVAIPLPALILDVRRRVWEQLPPPWWQRLLLRAFSHRRLARLGGTALAVVSAPLRRKGFLRLPFAARHTAWRSLPALWLRPARTRLRPVADSSPDVAIPSVAQPSDPTPPVASPETGQPRVAGPGTALFIQCLTDRLAPEIAQATVALLEATGASVEVPQAQHCCGLTAYDAGDWNAARRMARQTVETFEAYDVIVTPAASCAIAIVHDYPRLFADDREWRERARAVAGRVFDLASYLRSPTRIPDGLLAQGDGEQGDEQRVAVHRFCQSSNVLGAGDAVEALLRRLCGVETVTFEEQEVCCGFGGSTSLLAPEIAAGVLRRKLDAIEAVGVQTLVSTNPGCIMHLRGGVDAAGGSLRVLHLAEYLAARLPGAIRR